MSQLLTYLTFNGNCREAMTFYKDIIGGELKMQTVGETQSASQMPAADRNKIIHSTLTHGDFAIMASDHVGPGAQDFGDSVTLSLECTSEEEINRIFNQLADGGKVSFPLHTEFWGGIFGALTDRYGINWMFNYEHPDFHAPIGKQEVIVTHHFDAPRARVYQAYTDPNLVAQWWGPRNLTNSIDIMNTRPGGEWRIVQREPSGTQHAFRGVYHEVKPNERLVKTFEYEGMPGHPVLEVITFEDHEGGTRVIERSIFPSVEDRDGMVGMDMQSGVKDSHERLVELLKVKQAEKI